MKSTAPVNYHLPQFMSGIEVVGKRPKSMKSWTQDELEEFARRVRADEYTFQRYHGVKYLRVWEALALHNFLDPAVLGLNRKGRLRELKGVASRLISVNIRLFNFVSYFPSMLQDIGEGNLDCIKATSDLSQSFIALEKFHSYVTKKHLATYSQRTLKRKPAASPPWSQGLRDMVEGSELWRPVEEGGTVVPGLRSTEPDLEQFFCNRGHSPSLSKAMASICRPATAHFGRPPKSVAAESYKSVRKSNR